MEACRGTEGIAQLILTSALEVNGLPHAPDIFFYWRQEPPVYMKQETWWDPEPGSTFLKRKISCPYQDSKSGLSIPQPSLTTLHLFLTYFPVREKMEHSRMGTVSKHIVAAEQVKHRGTQNKDISRVRVATGTGGREGDKKKRYHWTCGFR
jgi:hypothetical protein